MTDGRMDSKADRPASVTNIWVNLSGVVLFLGAVYLMDQNWGDILLLARDWRGQALSDAEQAVVATLGATLVMLIPILGHDLLVVKRHRLPEAELQAASTTAGGRVALKTLGFGVTLAVIGFFYWLLPEYGDWYKRFWTLLGWVVPPILVAAPFYIWWVDRRMKAPQDGLYQAGLMVVSLVSSAMRHRLDRAKLTEYARGWLVKAFFMPLMFVFLTNNVMALMRWDPVSLEQRGFFAWYDLAFLLMYTIDLVFAFAGYAMTFRVLGAHLRSVEPTVLGWVVCLACYQPFWNLVSERYINYEEGYYWGTWLRDYEPLQWLWGVTIVLLLAGYTLATVSFGIRFSNLTYRGVITSGMYRLSKHPAYLCKNATWWLISVPWITASDGPSPVAMCAMLLGLNGIYYMRALTEERHLSNYPEYVAYARWMNDHGFLRGLCQLWPGLRYRPGHLGGQPSMVWWRRQSRPDQGPPPAPAE